jgi:hypothetical protein
MVDFLKPRPAGDPERVAAIKTWVAEAFHLPNGATVMVTELRCHEPGCPPLETVIAILNEADRTRQHKLHKAIADVTRGDVHGLAAHQGQEG